MGWRHLLFVLGSFASFSCRAQSVSFSDSTVTGASGRELGLSSILRNDKPLLIVYESFCIGCVEYLVKKEATESILFVVKDFSLTQIGMFPSIEGAENFYIDKDHVKTDEKMLLVFPPGNGDEMLTIGYSGLVALTSDFSAGRRQLRKRMKKSSAGWS
jgi:hypothetical protein